MTVTFENGTLKVLLSEAETVTHHIDNLLFGGDTKLSKTALANLYKEALQKITQKPFADRILIEIHPIFSGGCEILFTPKNNRIPVLIKQAKPCSIIIENDTAEDMIKTIGRLYFAKISNLESSLYQKNGMYRILLTANGNEKALLSLLYGTKCRKITTNIQLAITKEHWRLLCKNKSIETLGKAFFREP